MKNIFFLLFFIASVLTAHARGGELECICPASSQPLSSRADTSFHFNDGNVILLCGKKDNAILFGKTLYSGFVLFSCEQDTVISYWDDFDPCLVTTMKDTIFVEKMVYLPNGTGFRNRLNTWTVEKIFFLKGKMKRQLLLSKNIRKYNASEIQTVLNEFEMAGNEIDGTTIGLAGKLFIAAISGDANARNYFSMFTIKFGALDGVFEAEYNHLQEMLKLWDSH